MIVWLLPAALVGLVAVAGPLLVHLLHRQQARRTVIPTVRFVRASELSSARVRRLTDPWVLVVRVAIVACAVLALARPLLLNDLRRAGWSDRIARVVLVDASDSARPHIGDAQVDAEVAGGSPATVIHTPDLPDGLRRAVAWLDVAPPARREIVILSDFQTGSISNTDVGHVPSRIGLRLVRTAMTPAADEGSAFEVLDRERRLGARLQLGERATSVVYETGTAAMDGLTIHAPRAAAADVDMLLRVVRTAGAVAPSASEPIVVRFPGAPPAANVDGSAGAWTAGAAHSLLRSPEIRGIDVAVSHPSGALVVDVDADPGSLDAALVVKAALDARRDPRSLEEVEPRRIDEAVLTGWSRPPGTADPNTWRQTDESDGRWLWALALALLIVEALLRRSTGSAHQAREPHAA
jgi:hypothetical protein